MARKLILPVLWTTGAWAIACANGSLSDRPPFSIDGEGGGGPTPSGGMAATAGGTTSSSGPNNSAGTTSSTSGNPSTTGSSGSSASSMGGDSGIANGVIPEGYYVAGSWKGYAWNHTSGTGSTIAPSSFADVAFGMPYCASGSLVALPDYSGTATIGVNLNQSTGASAAVDTVVPSNDGILVSVNNRGGSALRVEIRGPNGEQDQSQRWCAPIEGSGGFIAWKTFNTACWDNSGSAYNNEPIVSAALLVPGDNEDVVTYDVCLNSIAEGAESSGGGMGSSSGGASSAMGGRDPGNGGTMGQNSQGGSSGSMNGGSQSGGAMSRGGMTSSGGMMFSMGGTSGGAMNATRGGTTSMGGTMATMGGMMATMGGMMPTMGGSTGSGGPTGTCMDPGGQICSNEINMHCGMTYEYWKDSGTGCMTNTADGFSVQWSNINDLLARKGMRPGSLNQVVTYEANYSPNGNSYLCVYGWSQDPLAEYYIVDSWGTWRPPGGEGFVATVTSDGGTYDIYKAQRVNQPSIKGTATFDQYWSVRQQKRTSGTITVANHFQAWASHGMKVGNLYEVSMTVEGYQSSGQATVKVSMK